MNRAPEAAGCQHERPAGRHKRLADVMMAVLRELGVGGTAAAKDSAATVESALQQFAHALVQALRQNGSSDKKADDGGGRVQGRHHVRLFLHTLAQSLAPDPAGSVQRAQLGGRLNVSA